MKKMTKLAVIKDFRAHVLPGIRAAYEQDRRIDYPARREAWNNYTDYLCKEGLISEHAYDTWACPW